MLPVNPPCLSDISQCCLWIHLVSQKFPNAACESTLSQTFPNVACESTLSLRSFPMLPVNPPCLSEVPHCCLWIYPVSQRFPNVAFETCSRSFPTLPLNPRCLSDVSQCCLGNMQDWVEPAELKHSNSGHQRFALINKNVSWPTRMMHDNMWNIVYICRRTDYLAWAKNSSVVGKWVFADSFALFVF